MKQTLLLLSLLGLTFFAKAEGIEFFKGSWEEAKQTAIEQDKIIFVDAYTSWCGPCKLMSKKVFTQKTVGDFYNSNFISVKLDMEKTDEGRKFARDYRVRSYPTLLFIDGAGEVVHLAVGAKQPNDFIALGKSVLKKMDKSESFQAEYEKGNREPAFIYKYVKSLNKAGKPSLKISNDYIKTQKDLSTTFNIKFLFEAVQEADSRLFNLMIQQKKGTIKMFGQSSFDKKIIEATNKTVNKAIEYESEDLLSEAKEKINLISDNQRAKLFHHRADKKYALLTGDTKKYLKVSQRYVKAIAGKDAVLMEQLAAEVKQFLSTDKKALAKAEQWAAKAFELEKTADRAWLYADFLYTNNKAKKALNVAKEGEELSKKDPLKARQFQQLIQKINILLSK